MALVTGAPPDPDPYWTWARATRFAYLAPDGRMPEWFPVLLELKQGRTARAFAAAMQEHARLIRVPGLYRFPVAGLDAATFCTGQVREAFIDSLGRAPFCDWVARFELGYPSAAPVPAPLPAARCANAAETPVMAVLDDGFAFAHERFRAADGSSRIEWLWAQDGGELRKAEIDRLLAAATHAGIVDEDEVYRRAGYAYARRRIEHGTHVLDIACGEDPAAAGPETARIVCVQLPARPNRGGTPLAAHLLDAMRYVLDRAAGRRVVITLSYASIAGPHDGTSILEKAMDELVMLRGVQSLSIVLPAGNSHLARCRAALHLAPGAERRLRWRILPDTGTASFLEIRSKGNREVEVEVEPPARAAGVEAFRVVRSGGMVLVAVAPTRAAAPSGTWVVRVRNCGSAPVAVDARIQRNDAVFGGLPFGRQSRFDDPDERRFDAQGRERLDDDAAGYVRRAGTLNALATGSRTIVVGAIRRSDGSAAPYSGRPETAARPLDALAPGDESPARRGVLAAGTRSGSFVAMDGTSVAAPQVARRIAGMDIASRRPDSRAAGDSSETESP
jgi:hypothetical protein